MRQSWIGLFVRDGKLAANVRQGIADFIAQFDGEQIDLIVRRHKRQRSLDQNAYWWAVPIAILAEHCGYEPEQMHYALLGEWRGYIDGLHGQPIPRCASSSKLTTAEFTELIEWVQRWAAQVMDVQIPAPNEWMESEAA